MDGRATRDHLDRDAEDLGAAMEPADGRPGDRRTRSCLSQVPAGRNGAGRWTAGRLALDWYRTAWLAVPQWSRPMDGRATFRNAPERPFSWKPQWSRPMDGRATSQHLGGAAAVGLAAMEPADGRPGDATNTTSWQADMSAAMEPADGRPGDVGRGAGRGQGDRAAMEPADGRSGDGKPADILASPRLAA